MGKTKLAVIGVGRIGVIHALHAHQVSKDTGLSQLVALVDPDLTRAQRMARELSPEIRVFGNVEELIASGASNASIVCNPTEQHEESARKLIEAGQRVLLEKPLTAGLESDRRFTKWLNENHPDALMLAFQRRYDEPLAYAKELAEEGAVGRVFKIVSVLEDSGPPPDGYSSPGILKDMSVHNVDEVLWLTGRMPVAAAATGSRLYCHKVSTAQEDYDDASLRLWFEGELSAEIQVSRNHVSGYRVETWIFGESGQIHIGRFEQQKLDVLVEVYGRKEPIESKEFSMTDYQRPVPEFVDRFGPAYRAELVDFVQRVDRGEAFPVNQNDGLRAMEVIEAGMASVMTEEKAAKITAGR